jgi:hypothetical protein
VVQLVLVAAHVRLGAAVEQRHVGQRPAAPARARRRSRCCRRRSPRRA